MNRIINPEIRVVFIGTEYADADSELTGDDLVFPIDDRSPWTGLVTGLSLVRLKYF